MRFLPPSIEGERNFAGYKPRYDFRNTLFEIKGEEGKGTLAYIEEMGIKPWSCGVRKTSGAGVVIPEQGRSKEDNTFHSSRTRARVPNAISSSRQRCRSTSPITPPPLGTRSPAPPPPPPRRHSPHTPTHNHTPHTPFFLHPKPTKKPTNPSKTTTRHENPPQPTPLPTRGFLPTGTARTERSTEPPRTALMPSPSPPVPWCRWSSRCSGSPTSWCLSCRSMRATSRAPQLRRGCTLPGG